MDRKPINILQAVSQVYRGAHSVLRSFLSNRGKGLLRFRKERFPFSLCVWVYFVCVLGGGGWVGGNAFVAHKALCSCNNTPMPNVSWHKVSNSLPVVGLKLMWEKLFGLRGIA